MSYKDKSGISDTCPYIDSAISAIVRMAGKLCDLENADDNWGVIENEAVKNLEKARTAHSDLRDWGNSEYQRAIDFEYEIDDLRAEIKDLNAQIRQMESQNE